MLLGLHGKARSGKDTAYQFISEIVEARRLAFADKMKLSIAGLLGITVDEVERFKLDGSLHLYIGTLYEGAISGRELIQRYGTEAHRDVFGFNFWVDQLLPIPKGLEEPLRQFYKDNHIVVTDVRFENEAQRIIDLGGEIWHIKRPEDDLSEALHDSERPLPSQMVNRTIYNDTTLEAFKVGVFDALVEAGVGHGAGTRTQVES